MNQTKKYAINEQLDQLPMAKRKFAIDILPNVLGIHFNSLNRYRAMCITDTADIPAETVFKLEKFFGIEPGSLRNYKVTTPTLDELFKKETAAA